MTSGLQFDLSSVSMCSIAASRHSYSVLVAREEPSYNLPQEPPQRMLMPMDLVSSVGKVFRFAHPRLAAAPAAEADPFFNPLVG